MTYQAIPIIDPTTFNQEQEVQVIDNDSKVLLEQIVIAQKLMLLHMEKITDENFLVEDINTINGSI